MPYPPPRLSRRKVGVPLPLFFLLFGEIVLKIPIFIVKLSEKMLDSSLRSMSNFVAISETESYDER